MSAPYILLWQTMATVVCTGCPITYCPGVLLGDVNSDSEVDTTDAYYIVIFYNEMIDAFPAEED